MTTVLDHPTATAETSMHPLSAGTALHANLRRDTEHPVADARLIAAAFAHQHQLPEDTADDLVQIVDALTVNAIKHAVWPDNHATVELTLTRIGEAIIIEVADPDRDHLPIWPNPGTYVDLALMLLGDPDTDADDMHLTCGRGLIDVAARAETTTCFREGGHKVVRAVLAIGKTAGDS